MWGYIIFPRILGVPRTKYFVDLCPKMWEMNAEREGCGRGGANPCYHFAGMWGCAPCHFWAVTALLSGCLVWLSEKIWSRRTWAGTLHSPECLLRCEQVWRWTPLVDRDCKCALQSPCSAHNPTREWEWNMGVGEPIRLPGLLTSWWSCHVFLCLRVGFCFITKWISYTYTYIPISLPSASPSHPPYLTPLGGHKAPSWPPCAMWLLPTSYLFYIW